MAVENFLEQPANQNSNVATEACKVARKETSVFTTSIFSNRDIPFSNSN